MSTSMTPSGLKLHQYTDTLWPVDWKFNIDRLHYTLLQLQYMGDVTITGRLNRDALKWDNAAQEYVNYAPIGPTTTTTSTTTTTTSTSTSTSTSSSTSSSTSTTNTEAPGTTTTLAPTSTTTTSTTTSTTATFTTTTTIAPGPSITSKSVILDIADNWGHVNLIGIRQIDFYFEGSKITNLFTTDFVGYETSNSGPGYAAEYGFDTNTNKTDISNFHEYRSAALATTNQRMICVFNTPTEFDSIVINNGHYKGGSTDYGAQNVKIHSSSDAISSTVYDEAIANSTLIFDGVFDEHIASDIEDDKILTLSLGGITTTTTTTTTTTSSSTSTTIAPASGYAAKSVILDIADNYGDGTYVGPRSIDFWYLGSKITNIKTTDFTADATSDSGPSLIADNSFDTSLVKTGQASGYQWLAAGTANQRLICVFNNVTTFDEIRINNGHNSGSLTTLGVQNVKIHFSTDAITSTVYNEAIANSTLIYDGTFDQHVATNTEDEQTLVIGEIIPTTTTTTTVVPPVTFTAKSIIIEAYDNWGDATYLSFRQVDFYFEGSKIANLYSTDFLSYDTSNIGYPARYVFDTTTLYTGDVTGNGWLSNNNTDQRLICVFNTPTEFDSIVINNAHQNGGITARGIQNARVYMSDDAITDTVVGNTISNSTLLFDGVFDEHALVNGQDDQILPIYAYPVTTTTTTTTTSSTTSTTVPPLPGWDARSVIFDIADNYSGTTYMGIRSIEFYDGASLVAYAIGDVNIYYTSQLTASYSAENAFDQTKAKDGGYTGTAWIGASGQVTNQRLVIDFTESVHFNSIVINNHHNSGGEVANGVENVEINISTDAISDNTYGAAISNSTLIYDGTFDQHAASSAADDQILILIP